MNSKSQIGRGECLIKMDSNLKIHFQSVIEIRFENKILTVTFH